MEPPHPTEPPASRPRCWAEIDLDAIRRNLDVAREVAAGASVMAVVKADAYGHGLETVAGALDDGRIAFFGVAGVGEARRLADAGIRTRIFLLGPTEPGERAEIARHGWTPCLSSLEEASSFEELARQARRPLAVHLAVDTGMGRGGFVAGELAGHLEALTACRHLEIEGIGTHLPSADEDTDFTRRQIAAFDRLVALLGGTDRFRFIHLANSAGLLGYRSEFANLVRPGLMLYGVSPLPEHTSRLRPALALKSRVTLVRTLPAGHGVSYGRTFITSSPTRVATIGLGYGDGLPRHLSGHGAALLVHGRRCPLLGRVTMDQVVVDVSHLDPPPRPGDEAVILGAQGGERIDALEIATRSGTIAWEILTRLTGRVPRIARGSLPESEGA